MPSFAALLPRAALYRELGGQELLDVGPAPGSVSLHQRPDGLVFVFCPNSPAATYVYDPKRLFNKGAGETGHTLCVRERRDYCTLPWGREWLGVCVRAVYL